jgi:hypothetical protein
MPARPAVRRLDVDVLGPAKLGGKETATVT